MKKKIALIAACAIAVCSVCALAACREDVNTLYGVVLELDKETYGENADLGVYIPRQGMVSIPDCEWIIGIDNTEGYAVKDGDLISLTFETQNISVMETYPAKFSCQPKQIKCIAEGLSITYDIQNHRNYYSVTVPATRISGTSTGQTLTINCSGSQITAEVLESTAENVTLLLTFDDTTLFFKEYNTFTVA